MTEHLIEEQLLNASELFHYAFRFKNSCFVVALTEATQLQRLIPDFSVIQHARIATVIVCPYSKQNEMEFLKLQSAGSSYKTITVDQIAEAIDPTEISTALSNNLIPVILCQEQPTEESNLFEFPTVNYALELARTIKADKVFLCSEQPGLKISGTFYSAPSQKNLEDIITMHLPSNLELAEVTTLLKILENDRFDLILLKAESGILFQEIFTNLGAGTLISRQHFLNCRKATLADVADICLLLKPAIRSGAVLNISESEVIDQISQFYVYTNNTLIVASACLKDYGTCYEISKVCTFPRYQGRGLARGLVRELLNQAKLEQKEYVFALSITERMWTLFKTLGFEEVEKNSLPEQWRQGYNLSRPSKAYRHGLDQIYR